VAILQEMVGFKIISSLIHHDLTESWEELRCDHFEVWLDGNSDWLIECHDREIDTGHKGVKSVEYTSISYFG